MEDVSKFRRFVITGAAGLAVLIVGLVWDAVLHARAPDLAANEGVFTLSNPGHLLAFAGLAATGIGLAGALFALLPARTASARGGRVVAVVAAGALVVGASGTAVWAMTSGHDHRDEAAEHEHDRDEQEPATEDAETTSDDDHGLAEHDSTGGREPTAEDEANADAFYDAVAAGTERYQDINVAIADGYVESANGNDGPIRHYMQRGGDPERDEAVDPENPSGLVYYVDENQTTLIGAVWVSRAEEPEQPGGPLTVWHDHSPMGCPEAHPDCPAADGIDDGEIPPRMLHVWLFEGADTFAHDFPGAIQGVGEDHQRGDPLPFDV